MTGHDASHRVTKAIDTFLSHLFFAPEVRANDIGDAIVGYGPRVEHVVRAGDDGPDALFHVKGHFGLLHY